MLEMDERIDKNTKQDLRRERTFTAKVPFCDSAMVEAIFEYYNTKDECPKLSVYALLKRLPEKRLVAQPR